MMRSSLPYGLSMPSNATEPTTSSDKACSWFNLAAYLTSKSAARSGYATGPTTSKDTEFSSAKVYEMYFPMMAERFFFVALGTSLGSVISACARAEPHLHPRASRSEERRVGK